MPELTAALAAFVLTHLIPALRPVRQTLIGSMGRGVYLAFYSAISIGVIVWLAMAYSAAPYIELWPPQAWARWVPVVVMPLSCVLMVGALSSPNPLSVAFGRGPFDPARPGIVSVSRHPLMWGLALWAGAHIPVNGDVAALTVFGVFLALSLLGPPSLDAKARKQLGAAEWTRLAAQTASIPFGAIALGTGTLDARGIGLGRVLAGLILYGVFIFGHADVIGVTPLP